MKKSSIYPNRSQELLSLFEGVGNPSKLMCVGITAMLLNRRANTVARHSPACIATCKP